MKQVKIIIDFRKGKDKKEKSFTGITLGRNDIIKVGVYGVHRMKVSTVQERYGKEGVIELLNHYDLEKEILMEYHLLPKRNEDDQDKQDWIQELLDSPVPVGGSFVTTSTQDVDEETLDLYQEYENDLDCYDNPVSYDPEDDDEFGYPWGCDSYKPWIYGR